MFDFFRSIGRFLRPYRWHCALILGLLVLETGFGALIPLSLRYLIDSALVTKDARALGVTVVTLGTAAIIISVAGLGRDYLVTRIQANVLGDIRSGMFEHLQKLSLDFYAHTRTGEILSRFSTDLASVENAMSTVVPWGVIPVLDCIVCSSLLIALDWRLALISLLIWPWILLIPKSLVPKVSNESFIRKSHDDEILSTVQENVTAQPVVKAFALERLAIGRFLTRNTDLQKSSKRVGLLTALLERSANAGILVLQVVTLGAGAYMAFSGRLSVGTLASFQALFLTLSYALLYATQYLPTLVPAATGMGRIDSLLLERPDIPDSPDAKALPPFRSQIQFDAIGFRYSGSERTLTDIHIAIPRGSSVAFVGSSGSGKSTLLNLLLRFYDPTTGSIRIDGVDIRHVTQASLRSQMSVVFQDSFLFNTTFRENIRLGRPGATDEEVEAAARTAEIDDFIKVQPQGYETQVGERGGRLSGGQRQRIAIARALVREPQILLLDEPTSALDPGTEQALNATIERIAAHCTVICVTHRLASVVSADRVFVMDKGRTVEQGNHNTLLENGGFYAALWKKQTGFKIDSVGHRVDVDVEKLRTFPILSDLKDSFLEELRPHFSTEFFPADRIILHEGDPGARFYIIVRGTVVVTKENTEKGAPEILGTLQDGDFFGEIALLKDTARTASVTARQPTTCLTLNRESFDSILTRFPQMRDQVTQVARARYASQGGAW